MLGVHDKEMTLPQALTAIASLKAAAAEDHACIQRHIDAQMEALRTIARLEADIARVTAQRDRALNELEKHKAAPTVSVTDDAYRCHSVKIGGAFVTSFEERASADLVARRIVAALAASRSH